MVMADMKEQARERVVGTMLESVGGWGHHDEDVIGNDDHDDEELLEVIYKPGSRNIVFD